MIGLVPGDVVFTVGLGCRTLRDVGLYGTEGCGGFKDQMVSVRVWVGLLGDEDGFVHDDGALGGIAGFEDFAEADEGMHLVQVATHLGFHADQLRDVVVSFDLEEIALGLHAVEHAIKQVPAVRITVDGYEFRGVEEVAGRCWAR